MPTIPDNKEGIPLAHYAAVFAAQSGGEIALRLGLDYAGGFGLTFFNRTLNVTHPEFALEASPASNALTNSAARILVLRLLTEGARTPFSGGFLSYREVPWGETYDRSFDGRCRRRLAGTFGARLSDFSRSAEALGGARVSLGDAGYDLPLPCGASLRVILREGDDEFPASAQFLFSDNTVSLWSAEDLAVLGEVTIRALTEAN
ncbi:MAG: DUF3786 domain-containing protein [Oscillospiraceae bacterium]|jgi:hypothetical protein|nr:DUF3786 domain-containing protein [Oscillospiraceae bacterium]